MKYKFIFFCLLFVLPLSSEARPLAQPLDRLKAFIQSTQSGKANFTQTVLTKGGTHPQLASGTMLFSRPGKFRWVYDKPYYQLIVGDGTLLWVFDRDLNQVTRRKQGSAIGASPAALLAGNHALEKEFILKDAGTADGLEWVEARPRSQDNAFELLRIGFKGSELSVMEMSDHFGQITLLKFSQFERNPPVRASSFQFSPPKGADVVGE